MTSNFFLKVWNKLDLDLSLYPRLFWNAVVRRKPVVIVDFQGALGDLVCFFSSLPGLRERHPGSWLVFITYPHYLNLVRSTGLVDVAAARYGFFHLLAHRFCASGSYYTPTAPVTLPPGVKEINPPIHTAVHFAEQLGVEARMDLVFLRPQRRIRERIEKRLAAINPNGLPLVVLHTGPTWKVKEWPAEYWKELGEMLRNNLRACVIQIGSETGSPAMRVPHAIDWINRLDLMESVAVLERAQLYLGIDSGPLHLATTLAVPTIGLFGPVIGRYRAHPRAPFTCLTANVPCLGCHHDPAGELHWRTGCPYDIRCMKGIAVQDVFAAMKSVLGTTTAPALKA